MSLRKSIRQYSKLLVYSFSMTTAILLWGYDLVVVGSITAIPAFQRDFGQFLDDEWIIPALWLSLWSAFGPLGQALGAVTGGWLQDRIGRRINLFIGGVIVTISVAIVFLANRIPDMDGRRTMFLVGKFLQGYATAIIKIQSLTYISEIMPTSLRGPAMALFPTFTLLGQLIGAVVIFVVSDIESERSYLIALGSQWVLSISPFVLAFAMPESPAYLVRKKNMDGALKSLNRLFAPKNNPHEALERLRISIEAEEKVAEKVTYADCFNGANRRRTFIVIFANFLPPFFGLPLLSSASYFLQQVGMSSSNSLLFLIVGIVLGLLSNAASVWTISHIGRRKLTITTLFLSAALWAGMGISGFWHNSFTPWFTGAMAMVIIVVCGMGAWPTSYVVMSESSALRLRAKSQAIGGIAAYLSAIVTNFVLPYFYNPDAADLGGKTGFLFTALSLTGAVWMWLLVPEMKGRSVDEINHLFEQRVPARGSSKWKDHTEGVRMNGLIIQSSGQQTSSGV
ncbi:MFS general substrate transporter [Zopfia rhizophila CBS 207.26]|uniref:MFS general substrate transporter n=1 Tax=Zopfia rhizophila CBS 207.26 TaxID=1314779 RepID=A0A6A6DPB6_9PEZI|nr:MFS general substrate transporter [Zopfia rhizophila CBS 207.26]